MTRFSHLSDWLSWLESFKMDRSVPDSLTSFSIVAARLHLFPFINNVVTVAGTNGKGSCVALLEAIYSDAGYRVGSYTSPHLLVFNERIRINLKNATDDEICDAFQKIDHARDDIMLSYFQFATLAALMLFQANHLDLVILEVGIGGRRDVVNQVEPALSIITSIDLDHMLLLGSSREEIALEKAGIMRENKPTICGDLHPPKTLFDEAKRVGAKLFCIKRDFDYKVTKAKESWGWSSKSRQLNHLPLPSILLVNAATSLKAVELMQSIMPVPRSNICNGLKNVFLPGRQEIIRAGDCTILFDVAHNERAAALLLEKIHAMEVKGRIFVVIGMKEDKDISAVLKLFISEADKWFVATLNTSKGAKAQQIADYLSDMNQENVCCFDSPREAFLSAKKQISADDIIVVFGSFVTAGEVMKIYYSESSIAVQDKSRLVPTI